MMLRSNFQGKITIKGARGDLHSAGMKKKIFFFSNTWERKIFRMKNPFLDNEGLRMYAKRTCGRWMVENESSNFIILRVR